MDPINVFSLDPYLSALLKGNWQTLLLLFGFLKGLAVLTPNTYDDRIVTLLQNSLRLKKNEPEE